MTRYFQKIDDRQNKDAFIKTYIIFIQEIQSQQMLDPYFLSPTCLTYVYNANKQVS